MLSAASRPTLAKNARMGHPRFVRGKEEQSVEKAGPPVHDDFPLRQQSALFSSEGNATTPHRRSFSDATLASVPFISVAWMCFE